MQENEVAGRPEEYSLTFEAHDFLPVKDRNRNLILGIRVFVSSDRTKLPCDPAHVTLGWMGEREEGFFEILSNAFLSVGSIFFQVNRLIGRD